MAEARPAARFTARARHIPGHANPLVGRRFVLEQAAQTLDRNFATVLWGPPGIGKSRLAHALADHWFSARTDGDVWVVDLASATDATTALATIAATIGEGGASDPAARVAGLLGRGRPTLLVLDHCEHLATPMAEWVASWRGDGAGRVIATSRVTIDGMPSFAVPPLSEDEALRLIEQRARRVRDSFRIDGATREDLRRLVQRVDALPGALELLAPRLMLLSPAALLDRMESGPGALHGAIDRSWQLLDVREQHVLRQLAATRHGFDLELAERMVECEGDLLGVLESLTRHAWLHTVETTHDMRLQLLHEPQRFLRELGVDADARDRHLEAILELGERWDAGIESPDEVACTRKLTQNLPNLWAAWEYATSTRRARLALVLHMALQRGGSPERQDELTREAIELAAASEDGELLARALLARARVLRWTGNIAESRALLEQALPIGDASTRCGALRNLAAGAYAAGDMDASRRWADEALRTAVEEGDTTDEINARNGLGFLLSATGDLEGAGEQLRRALELASQPGQPDGLFALVSSSLAGLAVRAKRWLDAEFHGSQALAAYEKLGYQRHVPLELLYRAEARLAAGRLAAADDDIATAELIARRWLYDSLALRAAYLRGVSAIAHGDAVAAMEALGVAANRLAVRDDPRLGVEVAIATAVARLLAGESDLAATHLEEIDDEDARYLIGLARGQRPGAHEAQDALRQVCVDALSSKPRTLTIDADGRGFQFDGGDHVDLTRRRALRGILEALTVRHRGEPLTLEEIQEAGWPGEVTTVDSGNRRVYVTIKRLRDLGLDEALLTVGDGYMLDPNLRVSRS